MKNEKKENNCNHINPFSDNIVREPRKVNNKYSVHSLNETIIKKLMGKIKSLSHDNIPKINRADHAQLVLSPHAGYGKSHLLGNLFRKLTQEATLVYLRPFADSATCWKSILLKMVQELDFPDNIAADSFNEDEPTQLDAFAHGILVHFIIEAVENGAIKVKNKKAFLEYLKKEKESAFVNKRQWVKWVTKNFGKIKSKNFEFLEKWFKKQLKTYGVILNSNPSSFLRVLFTYSYFSYDNDDIRDACLDWLKGGVIDDDYGKKIGINSNDLVSIDMGRSEKNAVCKDRIIDFCKLACFFRPFVFCFDQTEYFCKKEELVDALGSVIEELIANCPNQLTIITANQVPWTNEILPYLQDAYKQRVLMPPLELKGIDKKQGEELVKLRLEEFGCSEKTEKFLQHEQWFDSYFETGATWSVREFLTKCSEIWSKIIEEDTGGETIDNEVDIKKLYITYINKITAQPKRHVFAPDTFGALLKDIAIHIPEVTIENYTNKRDNKDYFSLLFKVDGKSILIGFSDSSNGQTWKAITKQANGLYTGKQITKAVFFRTPDLKTIPVKTWLVIAPQIDDAKSKFLDIIHFNKDSMYKLYAGYDLFMDASEGNLKCTKEDATDFLVKELQWFWECIQRDLPVPGDKKKSGDTDFGGKDKEVTEIELAKKVKGIMKKKKFIDIKELTDEMHRVHKKKISKELVLEICGGINNINIIHSSNNIVIQWKP